MPEEEGQGKQPYQEIDESTLRERIERFHRFMRECLSCQQEVEAHWQFCAHCGARRSTECPRCGQPLPPSGAQSCPQCGLDIPRPSD